ncbi:MAG: sigma-70 family RNA polymerase sigma factor [Planctomycetes bacterium]|nr:sigma-70 family RNA polymerase sigma factor [Planctomycetota bacterium]
MSQSSAIPGGFPSTRLQPWQLWLESGESGYVRARDHLMKAYRAPLEQYCGSTGLSRSVAMDAGEVVSGFFASRLTGVEYLSAWTRSGMPLRNWLRNGIHLHVHELRRSRQRERRIESNTEAVEAAAEDEAAPFERLWVLSVLNGAVREVARELDARGRPAEWRMFWQHHIEEQSHEAVGRVFGCSASESAQICFRVRGMLRDSIAATLCADGIRDEAVLREILDMMEVLRGS